MISGLNDHILLRMKATAEFVPFPRWYLFGFPKTTNLCAMLYAAWSAIVTRSQNAPVFYKDRSYPAS
jgi:hypothetical protein